ncbi:sensor histidine kinase [Lapidilactobacillus wuchangensis]|uniref:sensor histidine kinase n=1 Tax=Lapidilactobacillus wuchangensis TaxID=2486001 RepID=UPI000F79E6AA|nr:HAMP domain-containing sensor histidine kinase [Lapidilactobacillus wuchangensis]
MHQTTTVIRKQRWQLFWAELISFTLIFVILALIILNLYRQTLYRDVDQNLTQQRTQLTSTKGQPQDVPNLPFQANAVVFNKNGQISNQAFIGQQNYNLFKTIKLTSLTVNQLQTLTLTHNQNQANFRALLVKASSKNANPAYAGHYVLLIQNIDPQIRAFSNFRLVLLLTLIICGLLAVGIAYLLTRRSMKPIVQSWQKQRDFSADAAHELRTPLTIIQNNLEYLLTQPQATIVEQIEPINTALNETNRLKKITNDLLMLARGDAKALTSQPTVINSDQFWKKIVAPYQEIASSQQKSLLLQNFYHQTFVADPAQIQQLLVIFLDNALKYTQASDTIAVTIKANSGKLDLIVSDTGIGISPAAKTHIFDRFYRADRSRSQETGGSGLGLAIAQLIVRQHQGQLTVQDNQPTGTKMVVLMPLKTQLQESKR